MEENQTQTSRTQSIIRFAIVGVILVLLLIAGLYFGKQAMNNAEQTKISPDSAKVAEQRAENSAAEKKIAEQRAAEQKTAEKEAAVKKEEERKAAEAKKAEEKKKAEAAAAERNAQSANPAPAQTPPAGSAATIPSTGPVEVVAVLLGLSALTYGMFSFVRSKRELTKVA